MITPKKKPLADKCSFSQGGPSEIAWNDMRYDSVCVHICCCGNQVSAGTMEMLWLEMVIDIIKGNLPNGRSLWHPSAILLYPQLSTSCPKRNKDWILSCNCACRRFAKSKFGHWHPLVCFCEYSYIHLVDFVFFNRHNQWNSRAPPYLMLLRFPLLLAFIENCLANNCLIA